MVTTLIFFFFFFIRKRLAVRQYFSYARHNLAALDIFAEVIKLTNQTGL